jgi:hypothetical protein
MTIHQYLMQASKDDARRADERERVLLEALGATLVRALFEDGLDHYGIAMRDPEGNEFDINLRSLARRSRRAVRMRYPPFGAETWRSAERPMVAQNRTLCASAARRVSGLLRHRAVGAVTGLPADGVAGVIGLASCGCRSGSGDRGDLRPAGAQPSLARIRLMWVSTVRSAMTSRAVVCRLVSPCTMSSAIWRSRRVSGRLRSFSGSRPRGVGLQSGGDPVAAADYAGGRQRWAEFGFGLAGKLVQSGRPGRWRSRRRQLPAALEGDNRSHPQA